ncbi:hypothetical protein Q8W71_05415 [Methylobacterium sp. NEAU 140]|uniref:hypothetical protein n=1 Tax=Methylobacterium sp. NEAU 140 TaxID=3064945 RepID=UPI002734821C|nr:hypothetical protein [Methylobacterium sp. NEAU 140]MDP4022051.1 hypothetical protein [Methylobacterium sp. NEAU 140]
MREPIPALPVDAGAVEEVAQAYLRAARGDAGAALAAVVRDALAEGEAWHRGLDEQLRLISRGYARGRLGA